MSRADIVEPADQISLLTHALCYRLHEVKERYDDVQGRTGVRSGTSRNDETHPVANTSHSEAEVTLQIFQIRN